MEKLFLIKLGLSFVIGGTWVIIATILADRFGSKTGGLLSGLPSTIIFSLFFLAWTQGTSLAVKATDIIPAIVGVDTLFLVNYLWLIKKGLWPALGASILLWLVFAFGLALFKFSHYWALMAGYLFILLVSVWVVEKKLKIKSVSGKKLVYTPGVILMRGLISGSIIAFSVLMGKISGPLIGGMFSCFPAMFISTIIVTYNSRGSVFSAATMKSAVLSTISLVVYSTAVRHSYLPLGIIWGSLFSVLVSFFSGYLVYRFLIKKLG